jgi:catechol 2,3-dioxygenase-like lactoylglutathione lyase family enzyme
MAKEPKRMDLDLNVTNPLGRHNRFYHVGIACRNLEAAMERVGGTFGVRWTPIADDPAANLFGPDGPSDGLVRRVHSIGSSVALELLEGGPGSTWETTKVAVTHHLAYWSPDVGPDVRALQADGWTVELAVLDPDGHPTEFAYVGKPGSVRIELVDERRRPAYLALTAQGAESAGQ